MFNVSVGAPINTCPYLKTMLIKIISIDVIVFSALQRLYAQALLARSAGSRDTPGPERHRRQASSEVQTVLKVLIILLFNL